MAQEKKKIHYVNNKEFLAAIVKRKQALKEAEESGVYDPETGVGTVSYTHLTLPTILVV